MGYIEDDRYVRVDLWKPSGKWKYTIALRWDHYLGRGVLLHDLFHNAMQEQFPDRFVGLRATCLEPYHEHSYPISIIL